MTSQAEAVHCLLMRLLMPGPGPNRVRAIANTDAHEVLLQKLFGRKDVGAADKSTKLSLQMTAQVRVLGTRPSG